MPAMTKLILALLALLAISLSPDTENPWFKVLQYAAGMSYLFYASHRLVKRSGVMRTECPDQPPTTTPDLHVGDKVSKTGGDYHFDGTIVSEFRKISGLIRYVVEDDRGVLHIYSAKNLTRNSHP